MSGAGWPVDPAVLPAFLLAMMVVELTPGPNMTYLAVISATRGRAAGFATVAGITAGLSVYLIVGLAALATASAVDARVLAALRWAGVAYMLWLALDAFRSVGEPQTAPAPADEPSTRRSLLRLALRGLLANLLNAKAAIFYLALLPGFTREGYGAPVAQAAILGAAHVVISVTVHSAIVLGASQVAARISARRRSVLRIAGGVSLLLVAAWLALPA